VRREKARERSEEERFEVSDVAESETFDGEDAAAIHRALDKLEPKHRVVLTLHFLEDFSIVEISQIIGCPDGTVKSRLHHAKKAMRKLLTGGINESK
jgi:RNA polymerase sigma-70 factor (ECF subfamily)